jgi:hypothetical protein
MTMTEPIDHPPTSAAIVIENLKRVMLDLPAGEYGSVSASWTRPNGMVKTITLSWSQAKQDTDG